MRHYVEMGLWIGQRTELPPWGANGAAWMAIWLAVVLVGVLLSTHWTTFCPQCFWGHSMPWLDFLWVCCAAYCFIACCFIVFHWAYPTPNGPICSTPNQAYINPSTKASYKITCVYRGLEIGLEKRSWIRNAIALMHYQGLIRRYRSYLPVTDQTPIITLHEGNTPLIRLHHLPQHLGMDVQWYVKYEGLNPTGSFKDRGMTMAITKAKEAGSQMVMCASTGNTSASAAAYAVRGGMRCAVMIPDGKIALGKLAQAMVCGAQVLQIGNFDDALKLVRDICNTHPITLVNSVNPYRLEGKQAAFEVVDELGEAPDFHFIPVGNAGNISAYWKGYTEYLKAGKSKRLPKMMGFQAAGSAPFVAGYPISDPQTIATAIQIGNPASWDLAIVARDDSKGIIDAVTDEQITVAQQALAANEGIFCEPASAASIAGVIKIHQTQPFPSGSVVVSTLTGHGLKDPNRAIEISPPILIDPTRDDVLRPTA